MTSISLTYNLLMFEFGAVMAKIGASVPLNVDPDSGWRHHAELGCISDVSEILIVFILKMKLPSNDPCR
jgi:hypothetical protein